METTSNSLPQWLFVNCKTLIGFEYPGYGLRERENASQDAILAEIPGWIDVLKRLHIDKKGVVVCGRSLGTFFALQFALALGQKCDGVILVSPMLTAAATKLTEPWYRVATLIDMLDNESTARKISPDVPVLIIHGEMDTTVPRWNSEALKRVFEAKNVNVQLEIISDKGHNDLMSTPKVREIVNNFMNSIINKQP